MEAVVDTRSIGQVLADLDTLLDALQHTVVAPATDRERLDALQAATRAEARLHAWRAGLAAALDADEAAWRAHGTSISTWLADTTNLTRTEAAGLVHHGHHLTRFPLVGEAASAGDVLPQQAHAITAVLTDLPDDLPAKVVEHAQHTMVGFAATYNSTELRRLARHLLDVVAPDTAEALEASRIERDHRHAQRTRHLTFTPDHHGSILIKGSLPDVAAEPLVRIVEAYAAAEKRALDAADPLAEYVTMAMRRADGLLAMANHHTHAALAPQHGGDRSRIVVTVTYETLATTAARAGLPTQTITGHLTTTGQRVPAGVLRQLLCDADILPAVLGGPSQILDVGRAHRLVTPAIPDRPRTQGRRLHLPRLRQTPTRLPRSPPPTLVGRRPNIASEPRPGMPPPPRHHRTRPRPHHRPLESPTRRRQHRRSHPTPARRPEPTTPTPHPVQPSALPRPARHHAVSGLAASGSRLAPA